MMDGHRLSFGAPAEPPVAPRPALRPRGMADIDARMNELAGARGVIFDLRGYPDSNHEVLKHLLTGPDTSDAWMRVPRIVHPDREQLLGYTEIGWGLVPAEPRITGRVVFITNARAISYAESVMGFVEGNGLGEIVGSATAGANGNVNRFTLPGDFQVTFTGMRVVKHDGSQHHTIGVLPTVPAEPTIEGLRAGRDELLERAIELIEGGGRSRDRGEGLRLTALMLPKAKRDGPIRIMEGTPVPAPSYGSPHGGSHGSADRRAAAPAPWERNSGSARSRKNPSWRPVRKQRTRHPLRRARRVRGRRRTGGRPPR